MPNRKYIPKATETAILVRCRRRCCLCFLLENDTTEKQGQIAHIDRDSSNAAEDNLAFLCLDHHDRYDGKSSQSKGLTEGEVKHAREKLETWLESGVGGNAKGPKETLIVPGEKATAVTLTLDHKLVSMTPSQYPTEHRYCLTARTFNSGGTRIDDWYMEVEIPNQLLLGHEKSLGAYVRERSNEKRTLFRPPNPMRPLLCGDHYDFSLNYRVNNDIFYDKPWVFEESVVFRAFVNGALAAELSKLGRELQNF